MMVRRPVDGPAGVGHERVHEEPQPANGSDIARAFLQAPLAQPQVKPMLSDEHFSVDGPLIKAWSSMKSFPPKDGSRRTPCRWMPWPAEFPRRKGSNEAHASTTDPDAPPCKKGDGWAPKLCHMGHVAMENRSLLNLPLQPR